MKRKMIYGGIIALIAVIALAAGCTTNQPATNEEAAIEVTIQQAMVGAKTIEPDIVMDITRYMVSWWPAGDVAATQSKEVTPAPNGTPTKFYLFLTTGMYNFKIDGFNAADPSAIGSGSYGPISVKPKVTTSVDIIVTPVSGQGNFAITVDWRAYAPNDLNAKVTAILYGPNDATLSTPLLTVTADPGLGEKVANVIGSYTNGYYKCVIQMKYDSNNAVIWSTIDALRIVTDYTSTETYFLNAQLKGVVSGGVTEDLQNPLNITLEVAASTGSGVYYASDALPEFFAVNVGTNIDVWAYPRIPDGTQAGLTTEVASFEWYLDGTLKIDPYTADGKTWEALKPGDDPLYAYSYSRFVNGAGLPLAPYSLTVMVKKISSTGATTLSSRSFQFIVVTP